MKKTGSVFPLICSILLISTIFSGCVEDKPQASVGMINIPGLTADQMNDPSYSLASFYQEEPIVINASSTAISLPLKVSDITYYSEVSSLFDLSSDQQQLLENNGFVVIPFNDNDDVISSYAYLKQQDIPVFITTDTFLHLYHIQFNEILKGLEERLFFQHILDLSYSLYTHSTEQYSSFTDPYVKNAGKDNMIYFAVALELLQTETEEAIGNEIIPTVSYTIPAEIKDVVDRELNYITAHEGFEISPLFSYKEDYSQYVPRGHYTDSELLRRYFKTMMWYGRMSFLLKGGDPACQNCDFLVNKSTSNTQTIQSILIASALPNLTNDERTLLSLWDELYAITSFFVGTSDDLTPQEYLSVTEEVFGSSFQSTVLANETTLHQLKGKLSLLRKPEIYGGTGNVIIEKPPGVPFTLEDLNETLEKTQGMRLMGQRFIPDSYMFQQLVFPAVDPYTGSGDTPFTLEMTMGGPARVFPRGLDVMNVLGSDQAANILEQEGDTDYTRYDSQLRKLQENFSAFNVTEWHRNLYFSWIYTLLPLLDSYEDEYPYYMKTDAWEQKSLHTALSSWTELRHDTILYAKQSYTPIKFTSIDPPVQKTSGYVEPAVEVYQRLHALTNMTLIGLQSFDVLNDTEENRVNSLINVLDRMIELSIKQLEGTVFSESDERFLSSIDETLENAVLGVSAKGKETTLVADVHTDTNTKQVLEEAVGYTDMIIVAVPNANGDLVCAAGPTLSYYEFKHPMDDRLTDETWKTLLESDDIPDRPEWVESFFEE